VLQSCLGLHLLSLCLLSTAVLDLRALQGSMGGAQDESDGGKCCKWEEKRDEVLVLQLSGCRVSARINHPQSPWDSLLTAMINYSSARCCWLAACLRMTFGRSRPLNGHRLLIAESLNCMLESVRRETRRRLAVGSAVGSIPVCIIRWRQEVTE
jgi:hypothetical protein